MELEEKKVLKALSQVNSIDLSALQQLRSRVTLDDCSQKVLQADIFVSLLQSYGPSTLKRLLCLPVKFEICTHPGTSPF
jgi:hypothetical protein